MYRVHVWNITRDRFECLWINWYFLDWYEIHNHPYTFLMEQLWKTFSQIPQETHALQLRFKCFDLSVAKLDEIFATLSQIIVQPKSRRKSPSPHWCGWRVDTKDAGESSPAAWFLSSPLNNCLSEFACLVFRRAIQLIFNPAVPCAILTQPKASWLQRSWAWLLRNCWVWEKWAVPVFTHQ